MTYEIVPASVLHLKPMTRKLRSAACITLSRYDIDPRLALHRAFMASHYCRTALANGAPIAMWGFEGTLLGNTAYVWLVLSNSITTIPLPIMREARRELATIMENYTEVATTVLPDDDAAIRFAIHLGFHDSDDQLELPVRERVMRVKADPQYRIPVGDHYVIGLGLHGGLH